MVVAVCGRANRYNLECRLLWMYEGEAAAGRPLWNRRGFDCNDMHISRLARSAIVTNHLPKGVVEASRQPVGRFGCQMPVEFRWSAKRHSTLGWSNKGDITDYGRWRLSVMSPFSFP
jgi:hypothetical protein